MKLLLTLFLLTTGSLVFAQPRPAIVLRDGRNAIVDNGRLMVTGLDGKILPAAPGSYTTREGRQLTVGDNGRLAPSASVVPQGADARSAPPGQAAAPSWLSGPVGRPDRAQGAVAEGTAASAGESPTRALAPSLPTGRQGHMGTASDVANATKTEDAVLKGLYELTMKLQAMETKQNAQLEAIASKQATLKDQLKSLQDGMMPIKNEIIAAIVKDSVMPSMQADYLALLKAINAKTQGLPPFTYPIKDGDEGAVYWSILKRDVDGLYFHLTHPD